MIKRKITIRNKSDVSRLKRQALRDAKTNARRISKGLKLNEIDYDIRFK